MALEDEAKKLLEAVPDICNLNTTLESLVSTLAAGAEIFKKAMKTVIDLVGEILAAIASVTDTIDAIITEVSVLLEEIITETLAVVENIKGIILETVTGLKMIVCDAANNFVNSIPEAIGVDSIAAKTIKSIPNYNDLPLNDITEAVAKASGVEDSFSQMNLIKNKAITAAYTVNASTGSMKVNIEKILKENV